MTGTQGTLLFITGPVLAVVIALVANARPVVVLAAAVIGELAAYGVARVVSSRALGQVGSNGHGMLFAHAQVGTSQRLLALGILFGFALLVGAAGIGFQYAVRRGSP